ncbi:hypothetical protein C8Q74DRAFT_1057282 [Fomes fomentarius]|nr:hypothetical protein C8Q74DRAFT_1057282 [Fomes fomentarius]
MRSSSRPPRNPISIRRHCETTASREIMLGRRVVQQIMFSILLWQKPWDAGLTLLTNSVESLVPSTITPYHCAWLQTKSSFTPPCPRSRRSLVPARARASNRSFPNRRPFLCRPTPRGRPSHYLRMPSLDDTITNQCSMCPPLHTTAPSGTMLPSQYHNGTVLKFSWPDCAERRLECVSCDGPGAASWGSRGISFLAKHAGQTVQLTRTARTFSKRQHHIRVTSVTTLCFASHSNVIPSPPHASVHCHRRGLGHYYVGACERLLHAFLAPR